MDIHHNEWPIILITNPKHPLYRIPTRENSNLQIESTHIRILAFSLDEIESCTVKIDNNDLQFCTKVNDNLYVLKWDPRNYQDQHQIEVTITDAVGRVRSVRQPFTNGNTEMEFGKLARFVLMSELTTVFMVPFWTAIFLCVVPLSLLKFWHWLISSKYIALFYYKKKNPQKR